MKFLRFISKFWFVHLILTIVIIIAITCFGPQLIYNNHAFLQNLKIRIILILLLILFWILVHLQVEFKQPAMSIEIPDEGNLKINGKRFLKNDKNPLIPWREQFPEARTLPILVVSGSKNSVASLRNQLGNVLAEARSGEKQFPVLWQLYQEIIVIELDQKLPLIAWKELLEILKNEWKYMIGLAYTISVSQILNNKALHAQFEQQKLIEFARRLPKSLPIYLVITQMDELIGFKEFFANSVASHKCLGFNVLTRYKHSYLEILQRELQMQTDRFRLQRIEQLTQFKDSENRHLLYLFPCYFESLAKNIVRWLSNLTAFNATEPLFNMIFFNGHLPHSKIHPFSIHCLLDFFKAREIKKQDSIFVRSNKLKIACLSLLINFAIYFGLLTIWLDSYLHATKMLTSFQQSLVNGNINAEIINEWQRQLLAQNFWLNAGLVINKNLVIEFDSLKLNIMKKAINEQLQIWFHKNLPNESNIQLYENLRIYLMLGLLKHRNVSQLLTWFTQHQNELALNVSQFKKYLENKETLVLDLSLVNNARAQLQSFSSLELAYEFLKANSGLNDQNLSLITGKQLLDIPVFVNIKPTIPAIYSKAWLSQNYAQINAAVRQANSEAWVLGTKNTLDNKLNFDALLNLYLEDYVAFWRNHVLFLNIINFADLNQAIQVINTVAQDNSIFDSLLNNLDENTHFANTIDGAPEATIYINKAFSTYALNQKNYQAVKVTLQALSQELTQVMNQPLDNHAALTLVSKHFAGGDDDALSHLEAQINYINSPLKEWLQSLTAQIWQLLLIQAREQLSTLWQQNVFSIYQNTLANRYPLQSSASQEISLADFNNFFAPDGIMSKFYQSYLQVFINNGSNLSNKIIDGHSIGFSKNFLQQLAQVKNIQRTFFVSGKANAAINFSIEPVDLSAQVAQVELRLGKQLIIYNHGPLESYQISWPSDDVNTDLIWQGLTANQKQYTHHQGIWSVFQLFQNAQQKISSQGLMVTLVQKTDYISFLIKTASVLNPFMAHALELNLPLQLYEDAL